MVCTLQEIADEKRKVKKDAKSAKQAAADVVLAAIGAAGLHEQSYEEPHSRKGTARPRVRRG